MMQASCNHFIDNSFDCRNQRINFSMLVTAVLLLAPALFGDILSYGVRNAMLALGCVFTVFYLVRHSDFNLRNIGIGFAWLAFALFALFDRYITSGDLSFAQVALPIVALATCALACSTSWVKTALLCVLGMLGIHLLATFLFYIIPELYMSTVKLWFFSENRNAIGYQSGLTAHYSNNGLLMAMGFLLACSFVLGSLKGKRFWWVIVSSLFLLALILTQKRAHLLFAILAFVCVFTLSSFKGKTLKIFLVVVIALIAASIAAMCLPGIAASFERLIGTFGSGDIAETVSGRNYLWATAIAGWQESPYIGNGWGSFVYVWPGGNLSIYAHNEILQLLNDVGIIGLIFFAILCFSSLRMAFMNMKIIENLKEKSNKYLRFAAYFSFSFELFILLYACTTGGLLQAPIDYIPFFFAVALSIALRTYILNRDMGVSLSA